MFAVSVGVGNNPDTFPKVGRSDCGGRNNRPLRVEPHLGQVPENGAHSSRKQPWDVLHEHVAGSKLANETGVL